MKSLILLSFLVTMPAIADVQCPNPAIFNDTSSFDDFDWQMVEKAKVRCITKYSANHCLTKFYKTAQRSYRCICVDKKYLTTIQDIFNLNH